jgi:hypothetical protein
MHARDDALVPFDEGRLIATLIPGAQFTSLESQNHVLLEDEPAWQTFVDEVHAFLGDPEPQPARQLPGELSTRGEQVLELVAADSATTRSPRGCTSASGLSSDTFRTRTPSSASPGRPRAPGPRRVTRSSPPSSDEAQRADRAR